MEGDELEGLLGKLRQAESVQELGIELSLMMYMDHPDFHPIQAIMMKLG